MSKPSHHLLAVHKPVFVDYEWTENVSFELYWRILFVNEPLCWNRHGIILILWTVSSLACVSFTWKGICHVGSFLWFCNLVIILERSQRWQIIFAVFSLCTWLDPDGCYLGLQAVTCVICFQIWSDVVKLYVDSVHDTK